ncbi:MAG TPA: trypsin-like peptidase domain-containing protein [Acidimicrobiales bacterium]
MSLAAQTDPDSTPAVPRARLRWPWLVAVVVAAVLGGLAGGLLVRWSGTSSVAFCQATSVAQEVLPSVVTILTGDAASSANGTGEIIRSGGYILTNDHVISIAADGGHLSVLYGDGQSSQATLVGRDPATDLAVIKASDGAPGRPVIGVGSSGSLRVGQPVVALGAPLGLSSTVTAGIVSALNRYVPVGAGGGQTAHLIDAIQTDASINPGNSGGPLVDCAGALVGINTAIATVPNSAGQAGGGSVGVGFAIPVDFASPLADQLIAHGQVNHPTFGLQAQAIPTPVARSSGVPAGLFVTEVDSGGPADQAGIRVRDVITEVGGHAATSADQLEVATLTRSPGDQVTITYWRDGTTTTVDVTLAPSS